MKKILITTSIVIFSFSVFFQTAYALLLPFGGKIVSSNTPGVLCPGIGPATIIPYNIASPTPYYAAPGLPAGYGIFTPGSYVLGVYSTTLIPVCQTTSAPPVPFPVFPVLLYGISNPTL